MEQKKPKLPQTLDSQLFKSKVLENYNLTNIINRSQFKFQSEHCDTLPRLAGSRRFFWLVFTGVIPDMQDDQGIFVDDNSRWVTQLASYRQHYYVKYKATLNFKKQMEQI